MQVCHAKFKPHTPEEQLFLTEMIARCKDLVAKHKLRVNHLRFGRQVKAYGSTGVAEYHTYTYRGDPNKVEFWINAHYTAMTEAGVRKLEHALVKGNFRFLPKDEQAAYVNTADASIVAYNLKNGRNLEASKRNRQYFAAEDYADTILGFYYSDVNLGDKIIVNPLDKTEAEVHTTEMQEHSVAAETKLNLKETKMFETQDVETQVDETQEVQVQVQVPEIAKADVQYTMTTLSDILEQKVKYGKSREAKLWTHMQLNLPFTGTRADFEALILESIEASETTRTDVSSMKRNTFSKLRRDNLITLA